MYTLSDYVWMIADGARVAAYADALRAQVQPGVRVLEVGAGFGFFSILAARAGASHVDAVETNPVVHLGPKVAAANGCTNRITFHHTDVTLLSLDRPVDLLIADLRGPTPFGARSLDVLMDARDRLLRKGGTIIAARDTTFVAPSRAPAGIRGELHAARGQQGIVLDAVERVIGDTPLGCSVMAEDLVAPGKAWLELDYRTVDRSTFTGEARWTCECQAIVEGLAVWFETDLGAGVTFSNEPGSAVAAYRQMFIPFRAPINVDRGDQLRIALGVRQVRGNNVWEWSAWLTSRDRTDEREVLRQNSLAEMVVDPAAFTITSPDVTPSLGPRGRALRDLLAGMDGRNSLGTLALKLRNAAPDLFRDAATAAEFAAHWTHAMDRLERGID